MIKRTIQRINTIIKHAETVEKDIEGLSLEQFKESDILVRATTFLIAQIGEQMIKIEETLKDDYEDLPWKEARNMRNLIVHVYDSVKAEVVYQTAKEDLNSLKSKMLLIREDLKKINN